MIDKPEATDLAKWTVSAAPENRCDSAEIGRITAKHTACSRAVAWVPAFLAILVGGRRCKLLCLGQCEKLGNLGEVAQQELPLIVVGCGMPERPADVFPVFVWRLTGPPGPLNAVDNRAISCVDAQIGARMSDLARRFFFAERTVLECIYRGMGVNCQRLMPSTAQMCESRKENPEQMRSVSGVVRN